MSSLLTAAQKAQANSLISDLADTFNQNITIINEVANATIQDNGNFNAFSDRKDSSITYSAISTVIPSRIKWIDKAEELAELSLIGDNHKSRVTMPITQNYGIVRIKVEKQYIDLVKNSTKIIVDGQDCQMFLNFTPHSIFETNFAVFYLSRQQ